MKEVFKTKSILSGRDCLDITGEHLPDGFRIWNGEEFWTTVSSLLELQSEITDILQYGAKQIVSSETTW